MYNLTKNPFLSVTGKASAVKVQTVALSTQEFDMDSTKDNNFVSSMISDQIVIETNSDRQSLTQEPLVKELGAAFNERNETTAINQSKVIVIVPLIKAIERTDMGVLIEQNNNIVTVPEPYSEMSLIQKEPRYDSPYHKMTYMYNLKRETCTSDSNARDAV